MKTLILIALALLFFHSASAQDSVQVYRMDDDITVTATRIPTAFSDVSREVTVISGKEIELIPAQSVPELLENIVGVDVKQRGMQGVQADISIRGAGFEQTLILINGLKLIDPQTGHHNMNLPLHISDIERIEILRGPGSRLYGPNAFGGVINIITKKTNTARATMGASLGQHNLYDSYINLYYPFMDSFHRFTISKSGSDGYRFNTDFNNLLFSHNSIINIGKHQLEISTGHNEKKFGANSFYTTRFPEQYEETRLQFVQSAVHFNYDNFSIKPQAFYRVNRDKFRLVRSDPDFYQNIHKTYVYGMDLQGHFNSPAGITTFGGEWVEERIDSNNLGDHLRKRNGMFLQQQINFYPVNIAVGGSAYYYTGEGWNGWPGIDIGISLAEKTRIFLSAAKAFRVPTYTELYYRDAATRGNSDLEPEESINLEAGIDHKPGNWEMQFSYFYRENSNLIDYVLNASDQIFYARNFTQMITRGAEASISLMNPLPFLNKVSMQFTHLDSDLDLKGETTRYSLTHFENQFILMFGYPVPLLSGLSQNWQIRYEESLLPSKQTITDTRFLWQQESFNIYLDITNIFAEKYEQVPGVPMPGRWIKAGFEYRLLGND